MAAERPETALETRIGTSCSRMDIAQTIAHSLSPRNDPCPCPLVAGVPPSPLEIWDLGLASRRF
jgi:hypothetical protein